ncbi:DUF397 domain-containing protein [Actinokineospora cianjurensis]|uniref:Uncharacterized protein DUF397 n=1 Tax=Actinokineospora cianjurensis TaxID=585224 RepID=A0A421BA40_9PSEU|nr:DUF397 domain-containing protein [Actinokineospora cianjurensis]RLK61188.1 uncharacterized protein DUF397 [Actinokineospora cianjurensis]
MNTIYRQSTFCSTGGCVQVAVLADGTVSLRDSKNLTIPAHTYTAEEWVAFTAGVKNGEFDLVPGGLLAG